MSTKVEKRGVLNFDKVVGLLEEYLPLGSLIEKLLSDPKAYNRYLGVVVQSKLDLMLRIWFYVKRKKCKVWVDSKYSFLSKGICELFLTPLGEKVETKSGVEKDLFENNDYVYEIDFIDLDITKAWVKSFANFIWNFEDDPFVFENDPVFGFRPIYSGSNIFADIGEDGTFSVSVDGVLRGSFEEEIVLCVNFKRVK